MARIRTLKPEFWADEKLSQLTPLDRLVFIGLISQADDAGRLVDSIRLLDGLLFPSTDDTCRESLDTLASLGRITRYTVASGQRLIQITHWDRHQRVDRRSPHVLPGPHEPSTESSPEATPELTPDDREKPGEMDALASDSRDRRECVANDSIVTRESLARSPCSDLGSGTGDQGPGTRDPPATPSRNRRARFGPASIPLPESLATDEFRTAWANWIRHRIELRKPLTETSVRATLDELARWGPERSLAAIHHTIRKGWIGLREPDPARGEGQPGLSFEGLRAFAGRQDE